MSGKSVTGTEIDRRLSSDTDTTSLTDDAVKRNEKLVPTIALDSNDVFERIAVPDSELMTGVNAEPRTAGAGAATVMLHTTVDATVMET